MKKVYLLYEGDAWLSSDSLVLMGVFSSKYTLYDAAEKLISEHVKDNFDPDEYSEYYTEEDFIEDELICLRDRHQTQGGQVNFMVEEAILDRLQEI